MHTATEVIGTWPDESREAAELVIEKYGEPDILTPYFLVWYSPGPWLRVVAHKHFDHHYFPAPHTDSVESFISYSVPIENFSDLARFDGSVVANRTKGELSARCHDEQANFLALNLAHDIITGKKTPEGARQYYAQEFLDIRLGNPAPYMDKLHFTPNGSPDTDEPLLSEEEIANAEKQHTNV